MYVWVLFSQKSLCWTHMIGLGIHSVTGMSARTLLLSPLVELFRLLTRITPSQCSWYSECVHLPCTNDWLSQQRSQPQNVWHKDNIWSLQRGVNTGYFRMTRWRSTHNYRIISLLQVLTFLKIAVILLLYYIDPAHSMDYTQVCIQVLNLMS